jgi:hypothetical protein
MDCSAVADCGLINYKLQITNYKLQITNCGLLRRDGLQIAPPWRIADWGLRNGGLELA